MTSSGQKKSRLKHTSSHRYILTYIHTYIHTYMQTYIHTYIYTSIHTNIHTYILLQYDELRAKKESIEKGLDDSEKNVEEDKKRKAGEQLKKSKVSLQHTATHCNTLQHVAAHCSTLQHPAARCSTLQHTATTHCNATLRRMRKMSRRIRNERPASN